MKYLKYLRYILLHKWYVMVECFKVGLYWRGLKHDISKFLPSEFFLYLDFFYGKYPFVKNPDFDFAWLLHQKRNDHHWQWWILYQDENDTEVIPMSYGARLEMICDWIGASKAQGKDGIEETREWYLKNKDKMVFSDITRKLVEKHLEEWE
jgi:hypothetical protein